VLPALAQLPPPVHNSNYIYKQHYHNFENDLAKIHDDYIKHLLTYKKLLQTRLLTTDNKKHDSTLTFDELIDNDSDHTLVPPRTRTTEGI